MLVPVQWLEFRDFLRATAQKTVRKLCLKCAKTVPIAPTNPANKLITKVTLFSFKFASARTRKIIKRCY